MRSRSAIICDLMRLNELKMKRGFVQQSYKGRVEISKNSYFLVVEFQYVYERYIVIRFDRRERLFLYETMATNGGQ